MENTQESFKDTNNPEEQASSQQKANNNLEEEDDLDKTQLTEDFQMLLQSQQSIEQDNNSINLNDWKIQSKHYAEFYVKNQNYMVGHKIYQGGQGSIYQGLNKINNQLLVFKQMEEKREYLKEKEMYLTLQQNETIRQNFIWLDHFQYDDVFQLLIMSKSDCSLLDLMKIKYEQFINKQKYKQWKDKNYQIDNLKFHLDKNQFLALLLFQIEAMIEFKKKNFYMQDNKPANILLKKQLKETEFIYLLRFSDLGAFYDIRDNQIVQKQYPTHCSQFYFDIDLYEQKQGQIYTEVDVMQNEIFTIARSIQKCLFPINKFEEVSIILERNNLNLFIQQLEKQYDKHVAQIFEKMVYPQRQNRYQSFQELYDDLQQNNEQYFKRSLKFLLNYPWNGCNKSIRERNKQTNQQFYKNYFKELFNNKEEKSKLSFEKVMTIVSYYLKYNQYIPALQLLNLQKEHSMKNKNNRSRNLDLNLSHLQQSQLFELYAMYYQQQKGNGNRKFAQDAIKQSYQIAKQIYGKHNIELIPKLLKLARAYVFSPRDKLPHQLKRSLKIILINNGTKIESLPSIFQKQLKKQKYGRRMRKPPVQSNDMISFQYNYFGNHVVLAIETYYIFAQNCERFPENGNLTDASLYYEKVIQLCQECYKNQKEKNYLELNAMNGLARINKINKNIQQSIELHLEVLKLQQQKYGETSIICANTLDSIGSAYLSDKNLDKAQEFYEKSIDIKNSHYGNNHINTANSMIKLGQIYYRKNLYQQAKDLFEDIYLIASQQFGENSSHNIIILENLSKCYRKLKKLHLTFQIYKKIVGLMVSSTYLKYNKDRCLKYYEMLAQLYIKFNNKGMAIYQYRKAAKLSQGRSVLKFICNRIALNYEKQVLKLYFQLGKYNQVIKIFDKIAEFGKQLVKKEQIALEYKYIQAQTYSKLKQFKESITCFEECLEQHQGYNSIQKENIYYNLIINCQKLDDINCSNKAKQYMQQFVEFHSKVQGKKQQKRAQQIMKLIQKLKSMPQLIK